MNRKKKKIIRKIVARFIALLMCVTFMPSFAFAESVRAATIAENQGVVVEATDTSIILYDK